MAKPLCSRDATAAPADRQTLQVLIASELYKLIRRIGLSDRQEVVLACMQLLHLVLSMRHFHGQCATLLILRIST